MCICVYDEDDGCVSDAFVGEDGDDTDSESVGASTSTAAARLACWT